MAWVNESTLTEVVLVTLAFVLSAAVGIERERGKKSAGLRTHTLVGLGSSVFTLVSAYGFATVVGDDVIVDPSRIAAQVVSGIGFLGAGVIFVRGKAVSGLTTAASVWVTASIGMACGAGMPVLAVMTTILYMVAVGILTILGRRLPKTNFDHLVVLQYKENRSVLRVILANASRLGYRVALTDTRKIEVPGKVMRVEASLRFTESKSHAVEELVETLSGVRGVVAVRLAQGSEID